MSDKISVAIVQAAPVFNDLAGSMAKLREWVDKAAKDGAEMVVFGECWLAGYPVWLDCCPDAALWDAAPTKEVFGQMLKNSVFVPGPETDELGKMAQEKNIVLALGVNERLQTGTLLNSFLIFSPSGELVHHHRKLMPTYTERMLYGLGDGKGLDVVEWKEVKIGGLICWEHWMPHARQAMHDRGEQIHVALWPNVHEMLQIASRSYAFEGRCFVLAAGQIIRAGDLPSGLRLPDHLQDQPDHLLLKGGSCIIGPDGSYICEPVFNKECILQAELSMDRIWQEKMTLDVSGHYARKDIFTFEVDKRRNTTKYE